MEKILVGFLVLSICMMETTWILYACMATMMMSKAYMLQNGIKHESVRFIFGSFVISVATGVWSLTPLHEAVMIAHALAMTYTFARHLPFHVLEKVHVPLWIMYVACAGLHLYVL
jgi:ABC-type iron transport system FetAB permease component